MLPKLDIPIYSINLISTGKPVRFRPFLVKEQKLFLMSSESDDPNEMVSIIRQVLKNCIIDEINVDSLPTFDLEYLFLNLRARSVEEIVHLTYKCNNKLEEDKVCNGVVEFDINLLEIEPTKYENHKNKIMINDKLGVCFKYPTFDMLQKYESMDENQIIMKILVDCIDYIFDDEQIYSSKDSSREELEEFVDNLQQKDIEKFKDFFQTIPQIKKDVSFKCPKCSYEESVEIKGIQSFFV